MNITLIGMAGAGKSYTGKRLARALRSKFLDIDTVLEQIYGKGIQAILDEVGEEEYLRREARAYIAASAGRDNLVLSPGGSIIYTSEGADHMKESSKVIYLRVPFEVVESRLKGLPPRAIIGLSTKTLRELYLERHPRYESFADLVVDAKENSSSEIIEKITDFLKT